MQVPGKRAWFNQLCHCCTAGCCAPPWYANNCSIVPSLLLAAPNPVLQNPDSPKLPTCAAMRASSQPVWCTLLTNSGAWTMSTT